jgi:16S rRNA processing protein RimM
METSVSHALLKPVGRVKDAHSLKGELYVRLFSGSADWLERFTTAYLVAPDTHEIRELEVERAKPHRDGLILKIKDLDDRTPAEQLRGYGLEIPAELLVSAPGEDIFLNEVLGFKVHDLTTGIDTVVEAFGSNTVQDLLIVKVNGQERMIPFVKAFIEKIDFAKSTITMRLPLGLLVDEPRAPK